MEWCGVEGGRGSRAHSPELIVACVLVVTRVLIAHEPWWLFWLVVVHMCCGSWVMVKGACGWVVVAACGQWMLAGDCSQVVGGHCSCRLCRSIGAGHPLWVVVGGCGWLWLLLAGGVVSGQ